MIIMMIIELCTALKIIEVFALMECLSEEMISIKSLPKIFQKQSFHSDINHSCNQDNITKKSRPIPCES